jgi:hypothetical protein
MNYELRFNGGSLDGKIIACPSRPPTYYAPVYKPILVTQPLDLSGTIDIEHETYDLIEKIPAGMGIDGRYYPPIGFYTLRGNPNAIQF